MFQRTVVSMPLASIFDIYIDGKSIINISVGGRSRKKTSGILRKYST